MIIEIGTNDFKTSAGKVEGLFIEPVKYYFDRLPDGPVKPIKENVAISNCEGETAVYYLNDDDVYRFNMPHWIRGCCSIEKKHPSVLRYLEEHSIPESIIRMDVVPMVRLKTLINKHNIKEIDLLKIDTEGHDIVILRDYFHACDILPEQIIFEANELTDELDIMGMMDLLEWYGYQCQRGRYDVHAKLLNL